MLRRAVLTFAFILVSTSDSSLGITESWTEGPYHGSQETFFADVTGDGPDPTHPRYRRLNTTGGHRDSSATLVSTSRIEQSFTTFLFKGVRR